MIELSKQDIARLASFPEQNPNPVIELKLFGEITYLNPAARNSFPDLIQGDFSHPLFSVIKQRMDEDNAEINQNFTCEVSLENKIYQQKVFFIANTNLMRVYNHDITEQKSIEKSLSRLASFPEQNPSPIIELNFLKQVRYMNPAFKSRFSDFDTENLSHPIFIALHEKFEDLITRKINQYSSEVLIDDKHFLQQIIVLHDIDMIRIFNSDITEQKKNELIIREKNRNITDSINYAKRIQAAILPSEEFMKKYLEQSFILYKPKDIVAGDFYWMEHVDEITFVAAADCTGHGVPGAMVSVVCSNALNRAIKEFGLRNTNEILDKATDIVIETFEKGGPEIKDGMDISILAIDSKNNKIQWSGANNPLYYVNENGLIEIKPDKQPIGNYFRRKPFTAHTIEFKKNTVFYLITDGYADQFGGQFEKKYSYKLLREKLTEIANLSMHEQQITLDQNFLNWKGTLKQVDDVTLLGIHI